MNPRLVRRAFLTLKKDARMARLIKRYGKPDFKKGKSAYPALISAIIYQQLSGKAAATIYKRFCTIYGTKLPTPHAVLTTPLLKLRKAGLSGQKAAYLKDLSKKFLDGTIDPKHFKEMTDESIREHLMRVKGVGRWTADMFLMFTLHRMDVFPSGDLGIQKGMQKVCKLSSLPSPKKIERLSEIWAPYRTIASWYLWRLADELAG